MRAVSPLFPFLPSLHRCYNQAPGGRFVILSEAGLPSPPIIADSRRLPPHNRRSQPNVPFSSPSASRMYAEWWCRQSFLPPLPIFFSPVGAVVENAVKHKRTRFNKAPFCRATRWRLRARSIKMNTGSFFFLSFPLFPSRPTKEKDKEKEKNLFLPSLPG